MLALALPRRPDAGSGAVLSRPGGAVMHPPPSTILHVDGDAAARSALAEALRRAGFRVREAATGREALDLAKANVPDLVLLDANLPGGVGGPEVCQKLKADPA